MAFFTSFHHRSEYDSATEMAIANREYLEERAKRDRGSWLDLQILKSAQCIIDELSDTMPSPRNPLLDQQFSSKARILIGQNARSVTTFAFPDGSQAISLDADLLYEIATLIFSMSREAEYGPLLAACILYNNIESASVGFPMIREIALKCFEESPRLFDDIVRSCLYMLTFHEVGHEYSEHFCVNSRVTSATPSAGMTYRQVCYNPPYGPRYTVIQTSDLEERVYVPYPDWIEEFDADVFAMKATLAIVALGPPSFADFEKSIHHLAIWQFILWYFHVGNIYRDDPDRSTHPSAHNRLDLMIFHLDSIGVELFGDWKSSALTILQQRYVHLFSEAFARAHRALGERVIAIQSFVQVYSDGDEHAATFDKPKLMPVLRLMMEVDLIQMPLTAWARPLKDVSACLKQGYEEVLCEMAAVIAEMKFRFEETE